MRLTKRRNKATGKQADAFLAPIWTGHADYLNPFEFITFMRGPAVDLEFDVMFE